MQDLADAITVSFNTGLPIGRVLINSGVIKGPTLQAALFAQSYVRDCLIDEDLASDAINMVNAGKCSFEQALDWLGWKVGRSGVSKRLGELLREAGIISDDQLKVGLEASISTGFPLGRVLVLREQISTALAFTALTAQKLLRDEQINRTQATDAIRLAEEQDISLEESLNYHGYIGPDSIKSIRIGELLVLANVIDEGELLERVKRSITSGQLLGETMVQDGKLPHYLLSNALELQHLNAIGELEPSAAGEALRRVIATGITVAEAVRQVLEQASANASKSFGNQQLAQAPQLDFAVNESLRESLFRKIMANEELDDTQLIALKTSSLIDERETLIEESVTSIEGGKQATGTEINSISIVETFAEGVASLESLETDKAETIEKNESPASAAESLSLSQDSTNIKERKSEQNISESANHPLMKNQAEMKNQTEVSDGTNSVILLFEKDGIDTGKASAISKPESAEVHKLRSLKIQGSRGKKVKSQNRSQPSQATPVQASDIRELFAEQLELIKELSLRNEKLSHRAGFLEGMLAAKGTVIQNCQDSTESVKASEDQLNEAATQSEETGRKHLRRSKAKRSY